jgi:serine/threonine protein phosphatase PrpC
VSVCRPEESAFAATPLSECSISTYQANHDLEDRHFIVPRVAAAAHPTLIGVFDGHGGWQASEYARTTLPAVFEDALRKRSATSHKDVPEQVRVPRPVVCTFNCFR